jgi:hypothetical protein
MSVKRSAHEISCLAASISSRADRISLQKRDFELTKKSNNAFVTALLTHSPWSENFNTPLLAGIFAPGPASRYFVEHTSWKASMICSLYECL